MHRYGHVFATVAEVNGGRWHVRIEAADRPSLTLVSDAEDAVIYDAGGSYHPPAVEVPVIPPCPSRLNVLLATPLRLTQDGRPLGPREFSPAPSTF